MRAWRGGDVRAVYYSVLAVLVVWGIIALGFAQPIVLLKIGANVAGAVFVIAAPHLLYVNTRILPAHVGSMPRPESIRSLLRTCASGQQVDDAAFVAPVKARWPRRCASRPRLASTSSRTVR